MICQKGTFVLQTAVCAVPKGCYMEFLSRKYLLLEQVWFLQCLLFEYCFVRKHSVID